MPRQLNPELFGSQKPAQEPVSQPAAAPKWLKEEDGKVLALRLEALRKKLKELEAAIETQNGRSKDTQEGLKSRFERIQQHMQRQDAQLQANTQDVHNKLAKVVSRLNERLTSDSKIEELMDRQQQVLQGFELRLSQMQKIITEQELMLAAARSELKEAQREITRLKRL